MWGHWPNTTGCHASPLPHFSLIFVLYRWPDLNVYYCPLNSEVCHHLSNKMLSCIRVSWYLREPDIHVNRICRWFLCSLENFILSITGNELILMHIRIWPVLLTCFFFWYFAFFEHLNGWEWQEVLAEKRLVSSGLIPAFGTSKQKMLIFATVI